MRHLRVHWRLAGVASPLSTKVPKPLQSESPGKLLHQKFPAPGGISGPVVLRRGQGINEYFQ